MSFDSVELALDVLEEFATPYATNRGGISYDEGRGFSVFRRAPVEELALRRSTPEARAHAVEVTRLWRLRQLADPASAILLRAQQREWSRAYRERCKHNPSFRAALKAREARNLELQKVRRKADRAAARAARSPGNTRNGPARLLALAVERGEVGAADAVAMFGVSDCAARTMLSRLLKAGKLERVRPGAYRAVAK